MNKIIPVLMLIISVLCLAAAACGLITICVAINVPKLVLASVPFSIAALCCSMLNVGFALFLRKSAISRVAAAVSALAFILSLVSIIIWRAAL